LGCRSASLDKAVLFEKTIFQFVLMLALISLLLCASIGVIGVWFAVWITVFIGLRYASLLRRLRRRQ
jgi:hypothetical protein